MFCKNCGNQINEGAKFCKNCGAPVVAENIDTPVTFAVPPPFGGTETTVGEMPTATPLPPPLPPVPPSGVAPFEEAETSVGEMPPVITPPPPIGLAPQPPLLTSSPPVIPEKKGIALKYVLLGICGLIVLCVLACVGLFFFSDDSMSSFDEVYKEGNVPLKDVRKVEKSNEITGMVSSPSTTTTGTYTVRIKTFFHSEADASTVRKAYLVAGQEAYVERISNGFGYVVYTNKQGTVTRGWLKMDDLTKRR